MTHQAAIALGQSLRVLSAGADESAAQATGDVRIGAHDDLAALLVIAFVYSSHIDVVPLLIAFAAFALLLVLVSLHQGQRWLFALLGVVIWAALLSSGVDPVVAGLGIGLAATAYTPSRDELEQGCVDES